MMNKSYTAVDIETTGLNPKFDKIIEIGAVKVVDGQVADDFSTFIHPRRRLDDRIVQLTGIDNRMLLGAPGIEDVIGKVIKFCDGFPLLGHHIIFDYSFLKKAAVNAGLEFERDGIDTLTLCRKFMPEEERKSLASACAYYNINNQSAHRALSDAYAAHELYRALMICHGAELPEAFGKKTLIYKVKKEQPATKRQKEGLRELIKYHRIDVTVQIEHLTRNEVSRMKDKIISQYGRIVKR